MTGAYLLGLMPPELMATLDLDLPLVRRDPHYFLPTPDGRLAAARRGPDACAAVPRVLLRGRLQADQALDAELAPLREDLAPAWLQAPLSLEETAERYVRPELRHTFVDLVRGSARTTCALRVRDRPARRCTR